MKNKTILICLEKLGIGGVETVVYNQAITFKEMGYNVIVLAKHGIYTEKLEERGINCIDFEFPLESEYNFARAKQVEDIITKNHVSEVHIHQFPCITTMLPACAHTNIPYFAYIHIGYLIANNKAYNWFENTFDVFKMAFKLYFQSAYKIVSITEASAEYNSKRYEISKEKYIVVNNSINFGLYKPTDKKISYVSKFLILSRFTDEKIKTITNAIDLFIYYADISKYPDARLDIVGDGEESLYIQKYINNKNVNKYDINIHPSSNNVCEYINNTDILLGVDRCALEAITLKRLVVISGYNGIKEIIKPENIKEAIKENFSGFNLKQNTIENICNELLELDERTIGNIINSNYEYIKNNLDIKKNICTIRNFKNVNKENNIFLNYIMLLEEKLCNYKEKCDNLNNENSELNNKLKEKDEQQRLSSTKIGEVLSKNKDLSIELSRIYNSRRWIYASKIAKIFGK